MAEFFYINLDRSIERNQSMQNQFETLGINARRISAVDGRKLPRSEIKKRLGTDVREKQIPWLGAVGCFLSHLKIYEIIEAENIPFAVIMEDDLIIEEPKPKQIISEIENLQGNWNIVQMTYNHRKNFEVPIITNRYSREKLSNGYLISKYWWIIYGTGCYMITRDYACRLLEEHRKLGDLSCPLDYWLFSLNFATCWPHVLYKENPRKRRFPYLSFARMDTALSSTSTVLPLKEEREEVRSLRFKRTGHRPSTSERKNVQVKKKLISHKIKALLQFSGKTIKSRISPIKQSAKSLLLEYLPWTDQSLPSQLGLKSILIGIDNNGNYNFDKILDFKLGKKIKIKVIRSLIIKVFFRV